MPKGIAAVSWDDTKGTILRAKYPEDLQLTADEMMRIFTSHAMGDGKAGFMSMKLETMNVASFYTGLAARGESQYYIALLLSSAEDAGMFEEPLTESARELLKRVDTSSFKDLLIKNYETLSVFVRLTLEQRLALLLLDPTRKLVFRKLTEGCMTKIELQEWLEQEIGTAVPDIDLLLIPLIRTGTIRKSVVEGVTGDCIFLVRDMFAVFAPPETIMKKIMKGDIKGDAAKSYQNEIADFFKGYKASDDETERIAEVIADVDLYSVVSQLRSSVLEKAVLAKQINESANEVEKLIKNLTKLGIVSEVNNESNQKAYLLKADPQLSVFFPEYMVDNVRAKWASGELSKAMAVRYLQILREEFTGAITKAPKKPKAETKPKQEIKPKAEAKNKQQTKPKVRAS